MKIIPVGLTRAVGRQSLVMQKNAPNTLFAVGIVGVLGGTVLACRATLKLDEKLDQFKKEIDNVKTAPEVYDEEGSQISRPNDGRSLTHVYVSNSADILKLYGPALIVGGFGIACLTKSHTVLTQRNASLTAAYAVVTEAFDAYRERVREEVGEEKEEMLYRGLGEIEVIGEDGKKQKAISVRSGALSPYAVIFDEKSTSFRKSMDMNEMFIRANEAHANQMLHTRGHVLLNDVFDGLGLPRTKAGCVVGWLSNGGGDNYIDFNPVSAYYTNSSDPSEPRFILDFNVDGEIYDLIEE